MTDAEQSRKKQAAQTEADELRRTQFELDAQREKYFELFDLAPVGYVTLSDEGVVGEANFTAAHLLGMERPLLVGQPFSVFVFAPDRDAYYLHQRVLQKTAKPQTFELRLQRVEGDAAADHFWARLEARPRRHADGESPVLWVTFTDITENKQTEQRLLSIMKAVESSSDAIGISDAQGHHFFQNEALSTLLEYETAEELEAAGGGPAVIKDPQVAREMFEAIESGHPWAGELDLVTKNGRVVPAYERADAIIASDGTIIGLIGIITDITVRKQAEAEVRRLNDELEDRVLARTAELAATNRELEAFVYSASHDLRAPLRAIDGFSQMVIEDAAERLHATDLEHLQRVRAAAERMALLIDGLLVLSRAARKEMLRRSVDLSAMVASVVADLQIAQPERRVEVVISPDLVVDADPVLLHVILTNLLGNAWKFTAKHEAARIAVGTEDTDGERAFFVRDDGAGFDMDTAQHLFGAFQRLHTDTEFEGDGIGLATVQRLVARHGGHVWAEAEVEKGAAFFFTLPGERSGA
jgi:PAS domain S-box-containing protein